jgi:hypothetical protein
MKRLLLVLLIAAIALPLIAITPRSNVHSAKRIGVLRSEETIDPAAAIDIERELTKQLRDAGFDAFDAEVTLRDLERDAESGAEIYVLVSGVEATGHNVGVVDVGDAHVGTTLGVTMSRVAAEVRVYDGRTLDVLDRYELSHNTKSVAPTSIGFGDRNFFFSFAVPFVHHAQYRAAVRNVAAEAVKRIAAR